MLLSSTARKLLMSTLTRVNKYICVKMLFFVSRNVKSTENSYSSKDIVLKHYITQY